MATLGRRWSYPTWGSRRLYEAAGSDSLSRLLGQESTGQPVRRTPLPKLPASTNPASLVTAFAPAAEPKSALQAEEATVRWQSRPAMRHYRSTAFPGRKCFPTRIHSSRQRYTSSEKPSRTDSIGSRRRPRWGTCPERARNPIPACRRGQSSMPALSSRQGSFHSRFCAVSGRCYQCVTFRWPDLRATALPTVPEAVASAESEGEADLRQSGSPAARGISAGRARARRCLSRRPGHSPRAGG